MGSAMTRYKLSTVRLSLPGWPAPTPLPWTCPACGSVWLTVDAGVRCPHCGFHDVA